MPTRRDFLNAAAGAGVAGGLKALIQISPATAAETKVAPEIVRLDQHIEPIVRLIEETPREKCFDMMVQQLRRGLPYRQFLAALFLAGIRNVNPQPPGFKFHCVFVIHAAHQMSLDAAIEDRLLPLFWALDNFKVSQQKDINEGDFRLKPVTGKLPSVDMAWREFHSAMNDWDEAKADRAIVALVRSCGAHQIIEQLWQYGIRDYRNIGHKAIFVANTWRTLQTIGWQHAEPALRSLVLGLLDFGKSQRVNDFAFEDQSFLPNVAAADRSIKELPADWTLATDNSAATVQLLDLLRTCDFEGASTSALEMLKQKLRRAGAREIWDAVHLVAGELMMRQPGIYGIHTVTSASALRYAYQTAADPKTRLLALLQGIGWMCHFSKFMAGKSQGLKDLKITEIESAKSNGSAGSAAQEILNLVVKDKPAAAAKAMTFANEHENADVFFAAARRLVFRKGTDAHDYKYAVSIIEDFNRVSKRWRPHMLATATYHLRGSTLPDSPVMLRAIEATRTL